MNIQRPSNDRHKHKFLTVCLVLQLSLPFAFAQSATASPSAASAAAPQSTDLTFVDAGQEMRFRLASRTNGSGQFEVNVFLKQSRGLYDSERLVFYGRDLDGDHYPETWFIRQDIFITQVIHHDRTDFSRTASLGQDAIKHLISRIGQLPKDNYFKELFFAVGKMGTTTVSNLFEAKEEFVANEVDLTSIQVQINHRKDLLPRDAPLPLELQELQAIVEQGYDRNLDHYQKATEDDYWKSATIETAVDVSLIKVGELVSRGGVWIAKSMGNMSRAAKIAESFEAFSSRLKLKMGFGEKTGAVVDDAVLRTAFGLSYRGVMSRARLALRGLAARNALTEKAFAALGEIGRTYYRGAFTQFKYLTQTQLLQVLAEAYDKRAEIYDPNPIIMTKKLFSNRDFVQDFAFMTHESMLQAGIAAGPGSFKHRFVVAGLVSMVDSGIMNIAIKGEADPKRIAMDTGWEMFIGNLQTQTDVAALKYFEKLAEKQKNPKLKLVGYAIALVDQFTGYVAYSKASTAVSSPTPVKAKPGDLKLQVKLIPILAEVGNP